MNNPTPSLLDSNRTTRRAGRTVFNSAAVAGTAGLMTILVAGCTISDESGYAGDKTIGAKVFQGEDMTTRSLNRIVNAQAAVAARNDSTLRPDDFYGPELNGLGQQKLDLITLDGRPVSPLIIYLDMPGDDVVEGRKTTVLAYLKDKGLKDGQVKVEVGENPSAESASPAAPGMRTLHLLDSGAPAANPEPATGGVGGAAAGAGGASPSAAPSGIPGAPPAH